MSSKPRLSVPGRASATELTLVRPGKKPRRAEPREEEFKMEDAIEGLKTDNAETVHEESKALAVTLYGSKKWNAKFASFYGPVLLVECVNKWKDNGDIMECLCDCLQSFLHYWKAENETVEAIVLNLIYDGGRMVDSLIETMGKFPANKEIQNFSILAINNLFARLDAPDRHEAATKFLDDKDRMKAVFEAVKKVNTSEARTCEFLLLDNLFSAKNNDWLGGEEESRDN
jgi:hypothetical protein